MSGQLEIVKLTAGFKLDRGISAVPFEIYGRIVNGLLDHMHQKGITSFRRLKAERYHGLRAEYPSPPSHYIYTVCRIASSIYRSFKKLKRRDKARADKPFFKKDVVMLDDHLFSINLDSWEATIAAENGGVRAKLIHGTCHEKFENMRVGQAWLVKKNNEYYLKFVFRRMVKLKESDGKALAVDVNENNITFGAEARITQLKRRERCIRTAYFLKRRRLQSKPRLNDKPLMAKYRGREKRRVEAIYHKVVNEIVGESERQNCITIILGYLKNIRGRKKRPKGLNGRLNRWSFGRFQAIVKAKLAGLNVVHVKAEGTSSLCPRCRVKLSPSGYRLMKCPECGLEGGDVMAVSNLLQKHQRDVPPSTVQGESSSMT